MGKHLTCPISRSCMRKTIKHTKQYKQHKQHMYLMPGLQPDLHSEITTSEAMTRQQENNNVYSKNNILCI